MNEFITKLEANQRNSKESYSHQSERYIECAKMCKFNYFWKYPIQLLGEKKSCSKRVTANSIKSCIRQYNQITNSVNTILRLKRELWTQIGRECIIFRSWSNDNVYLRTFIYIRWLRSVKKSAFSRSIARGCQERKWRRRGKLPRAW